ncbi:hypothetical protein MTP99_015086 [Tenebrio molitor]|nr:hypothetical protein MTP99_015086 [Tenebrio molitor]
MTVNSIRILYVGRQIKFQSYLILEHLENISEGYDVDDLNIFYNEEYQKEVNKLKFCIRRHKHIAEFAKETNDAVKSLIVPFAITATLLGMTVLLIGFTGTIYYNYYQMILSPTLYLSTLFCAVEGAQCVEEETDKFSQVLFSNPCYDWAISVLKKVYSLGSVFFNMRGYMTK